MNWQGRGMLFCHIISLPLPYYRVGISRILLPDFAVCVARLFHHKY